jgi:hypothetical protein
MIKMKKMKKVNLPEVHILGDLEDVKKLVAGISRKNVILMFQDSDQGLFYLVGKKKIKLIEQKDITKLEKKFQVIFLSFFPSRKKVEPVIEETPAEPVSAPEKEEKKKKKEKKPEKGKKDKKGKKAAPQSG